MSQGSQGPFSAGRTILPLAKFSYATCHGESNAPIPWIHIGKTDRLVAIFEFESVKDGSGHAKGFKNFRVLNDPKVLEGIDLDVLASEANLAKAEAQDPRKNSKLVTVITKMPCVAIRYPLQGGRIRRIQIRLASNDYYFETLKLLDRANVPFSEAGTSTTQLQPPRPFSSSSSLLRPGDSASQIGTRPLSMSSRIGDLPSVHGDSVGLTSANPFRSMTSSGLVRGLLPGPPNEVSNYFSQLNRSPVQVGNSMLHVNEASPITPSASGVVSGYFGALEDLHSFRPQQGAGLEYEGSPGRIDLYQPRPSTAPMMGSQCQSLSSMPPPKRELPLLYPAPMEKLRTVSARVEQIQPNAEPLLSSSLPSFSKIKASGLDADSRRETLSEISVNSAANIPAAKGKRAIATKAPKPRAPKKEQTRVPAKVLAKSVSKTVKAVELSHSVPGVDQLFKDTGDASKDSMDSSPTIDTQALLSRIDARRIYERIEAPELTKEVRSTLSSQTAKCNCCRIRKGKCNGDNPCDWCIDEDLECSYEAPVNPASQLLVPSSEAEAVAQAQRKASPITNENATERSQEVAMRKDAIVSQAKAPAQNIPSAEGEIMREPVPHDVVPEAQTIDQDTTLMNPAPSPQSAGPGSSLHLVPAQAPVPTIDPLAILLHEPDFRSSTQLASWANLPESQQRSTLETWMCQQLGDPGFVTLVKRLDESWQATLFGESVGLGIDR